jgi:hypothetical protein
MRRKKKERKTRRKATALKEDSQHSVSSRNYENQFPKKIGFDFGFGPSRPNILFI